MAVADGVYGPFLRDSINNAKAFDLSDDTLNIEIVTDTHAPDFNADDELADLDNAVSGTNDPPYALASSTWAIAAGVATLDSNDVSETTVTFTNGEAAVGYDDTLTGDPLIWMTDFGAPASPSAGTFTITVDSAGWLNIDYVP